MYRREQLILVLPDAIRKVFPIWSPRLIYDPVDASLIYTTDIRSNTETLVNLIGCMIVRRPIDVLHRPGRFTELISCYFFK